MTEHLYITAITGPDIQNGPGMRLTIWIQGCSHNCPGCQNQQTHHYATDEYKKLYDYIQVFVEDEQQDNKMILNPKLVSILEEKILQKDTNGKFLYSGVTFSGGDPLSQSKNAIKELQQLINYIINIRKEANILDVWLYTGYKFEQLLNIDYLYDFLLNTFIDVIVDGQFIERLKPLDKNTLKYRGSTNQRLIDVFESLRKHKTIEYNI